MTANVELTEKERDYVFSIAMRYMKNEEAAADVAQETLLLAYRHQASFRGDARLTTWLYRIAATTSLMHLRKRRRLSKELLVAPRVSESEANDQLEQAAPGASPEQQCDARQQVELVHRKLEELGDKYDTIFRMRYFDGYTETEVASHLGLKVATVKTRAYRARMAIRDSLADATEPLAA